MHPSWPRRIDSPKVACMTGPEYCCRTSWLSPSATFRLEPEGLRWTRGRRQGRLAYGAVREAHIYKVRYLGSSASYWRCVLCYGHGRRLRLQAAHRLGPRQVEDRTASYIPFVKELEARIAAANPQAEFLPGRHWLARLEGAGGILLVAALRATSHIPLDRCSAAGAWIMGKLGPWLRGHRNARANLMAAYPQMPQPEIDKILRGMWNNLGRVTFEYGHLARLWDYDPERPRPGRIVLDEPTRQRWLALREGKGPVLTFSAHLANWELLCWGAGTRCGESAVMYRAPKIRALARELDRIRARSSATLIPADPEALLKVKAALERGAAVGMLVDEHSGRGVEVRFFGRTCKVNPALAQFARRFDCPVHGVRILRIQGTRFRFELTEPIPLPRDEAGRIDVAAAMQTITSTVEGWIREAPEQWAWLQRRWR
jgi:KDO2-lipid IV(A) lauroyltransferase